MFKKRWFVNPFWWLFELSYILYDFFDKCNTWLYFFLSTAWFYQYRIFCPFYHYSQINSLSAKNVRETISSPQLILCLSHKFFKTKNTITSSSHRTPFKNKTSDKKMIFLSYDKSSSTKVKRFAKLFFLAFPAL